MMRKAAVVGAGVAGLASAIRLAVNGFSVTVFEANPFVGGKINSKYLGPYRFDMGPSVFTGPQYVEELYKLCGKDFRTFKYHKLDHSFTYFYPDGLFFRLPAEEERMLDELAEKLGEDRRILKKYLAKSKGNYNRIAPLFIETSLHRFRHLMNKKLFRALAHLPKYKLNKTMHEENLTTFKNPKTVQFFNRYATYNGSDPYQAPAMLNMIQNLELNIGVFLPEKGMVQITRSLHELAEEQGVEFRFNEKVEEIVVENKQTTGLKTALGSYQADVVVSNMDVAFTYEKLLPNEYHPQKTLSQEKSSSAIVFYWGVKKEFKNLDVHNILFTADYKKEFDDIFKRKVLNSDPTIYINITSKQIKGDAPEGCENWFTMINTPINQGQDWTEIVKEARQLIVQKINKTLSTNIEEWIEVEDVMDPVIIEKKYSGKQGSIYGNASNNKFSAFYRHANYSKRLKGLYFAGVTVHPGGGIPLALNSAKIAVQCAMEDLAKVSL